MQLQRGRGGVSWTAPALAMAHGCVVVAAFFVMAGSNTASRRGHTLRLTRATRAHNVSVFFFPFP